MTVVKSDAMLQHEKQIVEITSHLPKRANNEIMHIEVRNLVVAVAAIAVVVIAILSMMGKI